MDSALRVTFPTEKQPFTVWIFKQLFPKKKKSECFSLKITRLNLDLGVSLFLTSFHKKHDFVRISKRKSPWGYFAGAEEKPFSAEWNR